MNVNRAEVPVRRIVSGGQTGVDRGALNAAIELGIEHGGWCPQGRLAEDGVIPAQYALTETDSADYPARTEQNVVDSDGTLILHRGRLSGGTSLTQQMARKHARPCLTLDLEAVADVESIRRWLAENNIRVLNVAGPCERSAPGIAAQTQALLVRLFGG